VDKVDSIVKRDFADRICRWISSRIAYPFGRVYRRVYRRMRGKSVADAINDVRIEAARCRLKDAEETIEAIAAEVGITNPGASIASSSPGSVDSHRV